MDESKSLEIVQTALPENRVANIWVAHEFLATGIGALNITHSMEGHSDLSMPASYVVFLGKASVGMTCLAQGFELLLSTITQAENLEISDARQHSLIKPFDEICEKSPELRKNIVSILGLNKEKPPLENAKNIVEILEKNFFAARYFGVQKGGSKLELVDATDTARLIMALAITFPMLRPIELVKLIGFSVGEMPPNSR